MKNKFSIKQRINSFGYAFNGLRILFFKEHNSWIHLLATIIVIIAGFIYRISLTEWLFILVMIALVFVTEIINSALEHLADFVSPQHSEVIKKVKDLAAAAVLLSAITALITAVIIFYPKIF